MNYIIKYAELNRLLIYMKSGNVVPEITKATKLGAINVYAIHQIFLLDFSRMNSSSDTADYSHDGPEVIAHVRQVIDFYRNLIDKSSQQ